jgi:hypothetical protein
MLLQIVEAQLENKNFNTPLPPTTAGLDASPAFFFKRARKFKLNQIVWCEASAILSSG